MSLSDVRQMLGWCTVINTAMLLFWLLLLIAARDWVYRLHGIWFKMPREQFDAAHYKGIMYFKLSIFLLNFTPWLALTIIS